MSIATHLGIGKLQYSLVAVAETAAGDGSSRQGESEWSCGARRHLYVGGEEAGVRGRQTLKKALVVIAAEENGRGIGRIRLARVRRATKTELHAFVKGSVEPGSTVFSDGWEGYVGLDEVGYRHEFVLLAGQQESAAELLPRVHRVASLLKRRLLGTHQGAVSREHLDYLLGQVHVSFQPPDLAPPGQVVLPAGSTGRGHRAYDLRPDGKARPRPASSQTTRYWGYGSKVNTPINYIQKSNPKTKQRGENDR